jgi:hypothetical protein
MYKPEQSTQRDDGSKEPSNVLAPYAAASLACHWTTPPFRLTTTAGHDRFPSVGGREGRSIDPGLCLGSPRSRCSTFQSNQVDIEGEADCRRLWHVALTDWIWLITDIGTGAGISVRAGIPDFRSAEGLFQSLKKENPKDGLSSGKDLFDASVFKVGVRVLAVEKAADH